MTHDRQAEYQGSLIFSVITSEVMAYKKLSLRQNRSKQIGTAGILIDID